MKKTNKPARKNMMTLAMILLGYGIVKIMLLTGNISNSFRGMLIPITAYITMALSLNLTVGVLGELSLGHAGFMSVGAFSGAVMASLLAEMTVSPPLRLIIAMVAGAVLGALVGFIVGVPVLRLNGDYLAIVTLAFGEIIKSSVNNLFIGIDSNGLHFSLIENKVNLAPAGKMILSGPMGLTGISKIASFEAGIILVLICLLIIFNLTDSKQGRAVQALNDNRIAAESVGINVANFKLGVFVLSAAMAGAAGALFSLNYSTMVAGKFDFNTSILVLVFVVLGGLGNMRGSIIAATVLTILPEAMRSFRDYRMLAYATVLILVMLVRNNEKLQHISKKAGDKFGDWLSRLFPKCYGPAKEGESDD